jgi:formylglycine-generating enzyme required for sulfatase activity
MNRHPGRLRAAIIPGCLPPAKRWMTAVLRHLRRAYLCAPNYSQRYRPQSRQGRNPGMGASNVGFRLVHEAAPRLERD